jgi:hypothetical protein
VDSFVTGLTIKVTKEKIVWLKIILPDMMQALVAKLYATITGNDENIKLPRNKFVSWLLPRTAI